MQCTLTRALTQKRAHSLVLQCVCECVCVAAQLVIVACGIKGSVAVGECSSPSPHLIYNLGSAWHREVSGGSDDIIAITFFRCGVAVLASPRPLPHIFRPSLHFRSAFPLSLFFCPPPVPVLWRSQSVKSPLRHSCALCRWYAVTYYNPFIGIALMRARAHRSVWSSGVQLWMRNVRGSCTENTSEEWVERVNEAPCSFTSLCPRAPVGLGAEGFLC